jgi:hypothetical protein
VFRSSTSRLARRIVVLSVLAVVLSASVAQAFTADFSLQLAPGQADATIDPGNPADKSLNLDLWVNLSSTSPLPGGLLSYSVYLRPSATNVIEYTPNSFTSSLAGMFPSMLGTDNSPVTGAFGQAPFGFSAVPISLGSTKLATFTVTALNPGTVGYSFTSDQTRPWSLDVQDNNAPPFYSASAVCTSTSLPFTINVVPEPATCGLALLAMAFCTRRGRRLS